jgi:hypothetical protein
MNRRHVSFALALILTGCALRVYYPLRSVRFEIRGLGGQRTVRDGTPEEIAYLDAWLKRSIDRTWSHGGKISDADVTAVMVVLLPAPAELYLQVGSEEVVIWRKGEFRYLLSRDEMAEFRHALGLPPRPPARRQQ